jgi:hypothetical protein
MPVDSGAGKTQPEALTPEEAEPILFNFEQIARASEEMNVPYPHSVKAVLFLVKGCRTLLSELDRLRGEVEKRERENRALRYAVKEIAFGDCPPDTTDHPCSTCPPKRILAACWPAWVDWGAPGLPEVRELRAAIPTCSHTNADECRCHCHNTPGVKHCMPCCRRCDVCGRYVTMAAWTLHESGLPANVTPRSCRSCQHEGLEKTNTPPCQSCTDYGCWQPKPDNPQPQDDLAALVRRVIVRLEADRENSERTSHDSRYTNSTRDYHKGVEVGYRLAVKALRQVIGEEGVR